MIEIKNVSRTFYTSGGKVEALKNVSLEIPDGDVFGVIGMSGAGKSTLVRCLNRLERPDSGSIIIDGCDITKLSERQLRKERRNIAMIFQSFNLLMQRNCLNNVCFPMELAGMKRAQAKKRALELLETVGLKDKALSYPAQLSGGQQQRVAIARALATDPKILLCDEATSALDPTTTNSILDLIRDINKKLKITVVIITHQMSVVESICKHVAVMEGGEVVESGEVSSVVSRPRSAAARKLFYPECDETNLALGGDGEHIIRVAFNGAKAAKTPLIAKMAAEKGIEANIAYASTKTIDGKVYGVMLLGIAGDADAVKRATEYLSQTEDITAEETEIYV